MPQSCKRRCFFENRAPIQTKPKQQAKTVVVKKPKLKIIGIISDGNTKRVLVQLDKKASVRGYWVGEKIQGWTVKEINVDYILLSLRNTEAKFSLANYPAL